MNTFWTKAEAFLTSLIALGVIKVGDSRQVAAILADIQAITQPGQQADALAAEVTKLLEDLGIHGAALHAADDFASFEHNIKNQQVGIIKGGASLFGVRVAYAAIPATSDQGVSLGLS